jgi:hypothetical protein
VRRLERENLEDVHRSDSISRTHSTIPIGHPQRPIPRCDKVPRRRGMRNESATIARSMSPFDVSAAAMRTEAPPEDEPSRKRPPSPARVGEPTR